MWTPSATTVGTASGVSQPRPYSSSAFQKNRNPPTPASSAQPHGDGPDMRGQLTGGVAVDESEAHQVDVDGGRVVLERHRYDMRQVVALRHPVDAEHHAGHVHPGAQQERHQLGDVRRLGGQPRHGHREAHVEQRLEQQGRQREQPGGPGVLTEADQDHDQRAHGEQQLLELLEGERYRQGGAGEVQGPYEAEIAGDRAGARRDRVRGERPDEDAGHQERDEVRYVALGLEQHAEDEVVDRRVEQRGHDLPDLAELRLAVLRGQPGGGEGGDEVPP